MKMQAYLQYSFKALYKPIVTSRLLRIFPNQRSDMSKGQGWPLPDPRPLKSGGTAFEILDTPHGISSTFRCLFPLAIKSLLVVRPCNSTFGGYEIGNRHLWSDRRNSCNRWNLEGPQNDIWAFGLIQAPKISPEEEEETLVIGCETLRGFAASYEIHCNHLPLVRWSYSCGRVALALVTFSAWWLWLCVRFVWLYSTFSIFS